MNIRFLELCPDKIFLLGYELKLSPTEDKLLRTIAEGGKSDVDSLTPILNSGITRGNIAVHVNGINKKAAKISGRRLVIHKNSRYVINPYM
jgi:hypothetical protein